MKKKLVIEIKEFTSGGVVWKVIENTVGNISLGDKHGQKIYTNDGDDLCGHSYLTKQQVIDGIQKVFTRGGELKWGEPCEVSFCDDEEWCERIYLAKNPTDTGYEHFVVAYEDDDRALAWKQCRPLSQEVKPTINGDIYTWEMES